MIKKSFVGLIKPRLAYQTIEQTPPEPEKISTPKCITLLLNEAYDPLAQKNSALINKGDAVKTGQKLSLRLESSAYVISSVTGNVSGISPFKGDFGRQYTAIEIAVAEDEEIDEQFTSLVEAPTLDVAKKYLSFLPGNPPESLFSANDASTPIDTIVICGMDTDLLITTNQYTLISDKSAIKTGVQILKQMTGVDHIVMAAPQHLMQDAGASGAEVRTVDSSYPASLPHMILQETLGRVVPAGKSFEDIGVCFVSVEAVASIGKAIEDGHIPVFKTFNLINKDGSAVLLSARIGTPIRDIFSAFNITVTERDRIVFGGPMTGSAVYSENHPIQPDTDAIMVQDRKDLAWVSDYPCINCGECIRICPTKVPVNMLVRLLEVANYEEAAEQYDLYSCIECGLCSFVCVSRMPILQYIKLAKYELARISLAEAHNV